MTAPSLYVMDDWTFQHLTVFLDHYCREEDVEEKREAVVSMLQAMPAEDAEYSLSHGWRHVLDLL
jgi:hypothetical protein